MVELDLTIHDLPAGHNETQVLVIVVRSPARYLDMLVAQHSRDPLANPPCTFSALHTQNVNRLPTAVGASASGKAFASAAMARQPVQ